MESVTEQSDEETLEFDYEVLNCYTSKFITRCFNPPRKTQSRLRFHLKTRNTHDINLNWMYFIQHPWVVLLNLSKLHYIGTKCHKH